MLRRYDFFSTVIGDTNVKTSRGDSAFYKEAQGLSFRQKLFVFFKQPRAEGNFRSGQQIQLRQDASPLQTMSGGGIVICDPLRHAKEHAADVIPTGFNIQGHQAQGKVGSGQGRRNCLGDFSL